MFRLAGLTLGLLALAILAEAIRGHFEWRAWEKQMRARGERSTLKAWLQRLNARETPPPLRPQGAAALMRLDVENLAPPDPARWVAPGKARAVSFEPAWLSDRGHTNTWDELGRQLTQAEPRLTLARRALLDKQFCVRSDYTKGFKQSYSHILAAVRLNDALRAAALLALHEGDRSEALTNLLAMIALDAALTTDAILITQLIRSKIAWQARAVTWEALQHRGWTEPQLALLQSAWEKLHYLEPALEAVAVERAMTATYFPGGPHFDWRGLKKAAYGEALFGLERPARDVVQDALASVLGDELAGNLLFAVHGGIWFMAWSKQNKLYVMRACQERLDLGRMALKRPRLLELLRQTASSTEDSYPWGLTGREPLSTYDQWRLLIPPTLIRSADRTLQQAARAEVFRAMTITAIAVHRYRLRYERWPAALANLVPEFCADYPRDWVDGLFIRYRPLAKGGFLLYSVGLNGRDDHGNPDPQGAHPDWGRGLDWVWPARANTASQ